MAVVIRLSRHGMKKKPIYRVVAADKRYPRDGRFLEILGTYDPKQPQSVGKLAFDKIDAWIAKGAKPSPTVAQMIKRSREAAQKANA